jgi:hypothetical protein
MALIFGISRCATAPSNDPATRAGHRELAPSAVRKPNNCLSVRSGWAGEQPGHIELKRRALLCQSQPEIFAAE